MVGRLLSSLPLVFMGGKLKGKEKTILDYFVALAVRMCCLFVLGDLPGIGFFFPPSFSFRNEIFLQELLVGFVIPLTCRMGVDTEVHSQEGWRGW